MPLLSGDLAPFLATRGTVVEVYLDRQAAAYRVRAPEAEHPGWHVAFPRELRTAGAEREGARYLVEHLRTVERKAPGRSYYRAAGRIWRLENGRPVEEVTATRAPRAHSKRRSP